MNKILFILILSLSSASLLLSVQLPSSFSFDRAPWHLVQNMTFQSRECMMCKFSVSLVNYALRTKRGADQVNRFANSFCNIAHIESPLVCSNITRLFNHEIIKVLSNALITPNQVCGYISNNTCGHYNDPMGDWEVDLNASTSLNQEELERLKSVHQRQLVANNRAQNQTYRVIHISDTHIDIKYKEGSIVNCEEPLCCRANSSGPIDGKPRIEAGFWGSYGSCDVPLRTLESALKTINSTIEQYGDVDYIIWTGDIQPHDVWEQNKQTAIETYDTVFDRIFQLLPNIRIFPTFGNHEMVPVDSFSPSNLLSIARDDSPEWLYRKLDSFWSKWLPDETVKTITKDGFYATTIKDGLKVISLNTNFCHNKNFWLYINATDPGNQLKWLIHELQISELQHEQVHIIGHIPPGSTDCLKVWSKNFNKIVRRFSKTISAQFYGHTHNNEFEIFYDQLDASINMEKITNNNISLEVTDLFRKNTSLPIPISTGLIGPSITTFIDLNPSFRIYTIDSSQDYTPVNFETFYMNLTEANLHQQEEPKWHSKLMCQEFSILDIKPISMHNLLLEMVDELKAFEPQKNSINTSSKKGFKIKNDTDINNNDIFNNNVEDSKFYKLFRMFFNYSDIYSRKEFDKWTIDEKKAFLCKFFTGHSHNTQACKQFISDNVNYDYISVM